MSFWNRSGISSPTRTKASSVAGRRSSNGRVRERTRAARRLFKGLRWVGASSSTRRTNSREWRGAPPPPRRGGGEEGGGGAGGGGGGGGEGGERSRPQQSPRSTRGGR